MRRSLSYEQFKGVQDEIERRFTPFGFKSCTGSVFRLRLDIEERSVFLLIATSPKRGFITCGLHRIDGRVPVLENVMDVAKTKRWESRLERRIARLANFAGLLPLCTCASHEPMVQTAHYDYRDRRVYFECPLVISGKCNQPPQPVPPEILRAVRAELNFRRKH